MTIFGKLGYDVIKKILHEEAHVILFLYNFLFFEIN